ncbi:MAG: hypothetical protein AAFO79_05515, partial [Pseudomonadota bacterium]
RLGRFATLFPYGPTRLDALEVVGQHPVLKIDMKQFLPTAPRNARNVLMFDHEFWRTRGGPARELFAQWLRGPLPKPVPVPVRKVSRASLPAASPQDG